MNQRKFKDMLNEFKDSRELGSDPYFDADEIDELLAYMEENDLNESADFKDILMLGLRMHPNSSNLKIREYRYLIDKKKYQEALDKIDALGEPDNQELETLRIECYINLSDLPKAFQIINHLIEEESEYALEIIEYTAILLNDTDMEEETEFFISKWLNRYPESIVLKEELCALYEDTGKIDEAIVLCNDLINQNPFSFDNWFVLGRLYALKGLFEDAVEAFDFALTIEDSNNYDLKALKIYCLYMNGSYEKAIETFKDFDDISIVFWPEVQSITAECYIKMERFDEAYKVLYPLIFKHLITDIRNYAIFIQASIETDRIIEAAFALKKAESIDPNDISLYLMNELLPVSFKEIEERADYKNEEIYLLLRDSLFNGEIQNVLVYAYIRYSIEKKDMEKALFYLNLLQESGEESKMMDICYAIAYKLSGDERYDSIIATMDYMERDFVKVELERLTSVKKNEKKPAKTEILRPVSPQEIIKDMLSKIENKN